MIVGVLGAGQLGRMLALAGLPLGLRFRFLSTSDDSCARDLGPLVVGRSFDDEEAIRRLARGDGAHGIDGGSVDLITYEFENVPARAIEIAARYAPAYPGALALMLAQDRVDEKQFFRSLGIGTPEFRAVSSRDDLEAAARELGLPFVLKSRRLGYDGKGQRVVRASSELDAAWDALGSATGGLIAERFVAFRRELSVIGVRDRRGQVRVYPVAENVHEGGILRSTIAPAPGLAPALEAAATSIVTRAMEELDYVGVLAIELFEVGDEEDGGLLVNEMACRVHNSGHWTMDGARTSQFENHLRAVAGFPLGDTAMRAGVTRAGMINLIGDHPAAGDLLALPGARVHLYGKAAKPGRKVGHINFACGDDGTLGDAMDRARALLARRV